MGVILMMSTIKKNILAGIFVLIGLSSIGSAQAFEFELHKALATKNGWIFIALSALSMYSLGKWKKVFQEKGYFGEKIEQFFSAIIPSAVVIYGANSLYMNANNSIPALENPDLLECMKKCVAAMPEAAAKLAAKAATK